MSIRVYTCQSMTGHAMHELVERAKKIKLVMNAAGISVLDPILAEHIPDKKEILGEKPLSVLKDYWRGDKQLIREAHVLVDLTPGDKSEGSSHELGYARYGLWKPVVRMYPPGIQPPNFIPYFEDDLIVHSPEEAAVQINKYWGSWSKRALWRFGLLNRCLLRWLFYQLKEWK